MNKKILPADIKELPDGKTKIPLNLVINRMGSSIKLSVEIDLNDIFLQSIENSEKKVYTDDN